MFCPKCGTALLEVAKFCPKCGRPVVKAGQNIHEHIVPPQTSEAEDEAPTGSEVLSEGLKEETAPDQEATTPPSLPQSSTLPPKKKPLVARIAIAIAIVLGLAPIIGASIFYIRQSNESDLMEHFLDFMYDEAVKKEDIIAFYDKKLAVPYSGGGYSISTDYQTFSISKTGDPNLFTAYGEIEVKDLSLGNVSPTYTVELRGTLITDFFRKDYRWDVTTFYQHPPQTQGTSGQNDLTIPTTSISVDPTDFVGHYTGVNDNMDSLIIECYDFIMSVSYGGYRTTYFSDAEVYISDYEEIDLNFLAKDALSGKYLDITLRYIPATDSPYWKDTIYLTSPDLENNVFTRDENSPRFESYSTDAEYLLPSDYQYITYSDLDRLTKEEVVLARNEIYARHGYTFQSENLRFYFEAQNWYFANPDVNASTFGTEDLNDYERANLETIQQYERDMGWK